MGAGWFNSGVLEPEHIFNPCNGAQVMLEIGWALQERYEAYNQPLSGSRKVNYYVPVQTGQGDIPYAPLFDLAWKPSADLSQFDGLHVASSSASGGRPVYFAIEAWRQAIADLITVTPVQDALGFYQEHVYTKADWTPWLTEAELLDDAGWPGGWIEDDWSRHNPELFTQFHDVLALLKQYTVVKKIYTAPNDNRRWSTFGGTWAEAIAASPTTKVDHIEASHSGGYYHCADSVRNVILFDGYQGEVQADISVEWAYRNTSNSVQIRLGDWLPVQSSYGTFGAWESATVPKESIVLGSGDVEIFTTMYPSAPGTFPGSVQTYPIKQDQDQYRVNIESVLTYG